LQQLGDVIRVIKQAKNQRNPRKQENKRNPTKNKEKPENIKPNTAS
jgi:ssDNA-binding replication factor A large subunit